MSTISKLEVEKERPIYFVEVYQEMMRDSDTDQMRNSVQNIFNLFKDDKVLADAEMNLFSLNPELQRNQANDSKFELCSDRMERLYPTYKLSDEGVF